MDNSHPKGCHVNSQRDLKVTVPSVTRLTCSSWFTMSGQNDEFQIVINCYKIFTACVATGDPPTVHKESTSTLY